MSENNQPKVEHFILDTGTYIDIRRYLGTRPHDETRALIQAFDSLPSVTEADIAKRAEQAARLAELEQLALARQATDTDIKISGLDKIVDESINEALQEMADDLEKAEKEGA